MTWTYVCKMMIERLAGGRIRAKYGDQIIKSPYGRISRAIYE